MGDLRDWSPERNGAILFSSPSSSNPNSEAIVAGSWGRAESATQKIISRVQPTGTSENRRSEVIDYVQKLIRGCLGCEVFPFGSVPLRTYLPDGDIDLTAFGGCNVEDALANGLRSVLESEEQNKAAKFTVKDVQLIRAEVKLVKCLVQNIVVDISFNQIGGLCTLCFLEQVDRLIGKDHLFKRSIILIKAWCYYESRILGAHHGLISTYALETLVLYIFHFFHSSLNGPLAVLYKFLDYFSKFDWDNYCISLNGPVRISSLPEIVVEAPPHSGSDLLLSSEFLRESVERFSVSSKLSETNFRAFSQKHLNIVDPLRENNNLGRSVSKGNFYRIRSAFTYGARKLGRILIGPVENVGDEIQKFFGNTLDRHGSGQRPDVQGPVSFSGYNVFDPAMPLPSIDTCSEDKITSESESADPKYAPSPFGLDKKICDNNNAMIPIKTVTDSLRDCTGEAASTNFSESTSHAKKMAISGDRVVGDAVDLATFKTQDLKISEESDNASSPRNEMSPLPMTKILLHAPHLYFSHSNSTNGEVKGESPDRKQLSSWKCIDTNISTEPIQVLDKETGAEVDNRVDESQSHSGLGPVGSKDDFHPGYRENVSLGFRGSPHTLNALPSLSGDYESHLNSLQYGQWFCEYAGSTTLPPMPSPLPSQIYNGNSSWDAAIRWPTQFRPNLLSCLNANGVPALFYPVNSAIVPGAATCCMEERPKSRGTGTYFPNASHYKDRPTTPRGRNNSQLRSPRSNCHGLMLPESNLTERSDHDPASPLQVPLPLHQGGGKPRSSEYSHSGFPGRKANLHANGWIPPFERVPELGNLPLETPSLESDRHSGHLNPSPFQRSNSSVSTAGTQRQKPFPGKDTDRVAIRSYHLKNDDDFPPLSV